MCKYGEFEACMIEKDHEEILRRLQQYEVTPAGLQKDENRLATVLHCTQNPIRSNGTREREYFKSLGKSSCDYFPLLVWLTMYWNDTIKRT